MRELTLSTPKSGQVIPAPIHKAVVNVQSKSRHPVRRSNSSPEMSSSWKGTARHPRDDSGRHQSDDPEPRDDLSLDAEDMILLPSCEPTCVPLPLVSFQRRAVLSYTYTSLKYILCVVYTSSIFV